MLLEFLPYRTQDAEEIYNEIMIRLPDQFEPTLEEFEVSSLLGDIISLQYDSGMTLHEALREVFYFE